MANLAVSILASSATILLGVMVASNSLPQLPGNMNQCIIANCSTPLKHCALDFTCVKAMVCDAKCQLEKAADNCNYLCEIDYMNSTTYRNVVQCMVDHKCIPKMKPDGVCLANDSEALQNITSMSQVQGKWWVLKGINCGQKGWPAGFDYLPCQRDHFFKEGSDWINHVAYCAGSNSTCTTPIVYTRANVTIPSPGVLSNSYMDAPLLPQIENFKVISWPHPDWMLFVYCGATPMGKYAGGSLISNSSRSILDIPPYVDRIFSSVAQKFNFSYEEMCITDATKCTD